MGLFDFVKDAGKKITGQDQEEKEAANREQAGRLTEHVKALGLQVDSLNVDYFDGTVTLKGLVPNRAEKEKVVLAVGNTQGVAKVNDMLRIVRPQPEASAADPVTPAPEAGPESSGQDDEPESTFYTVQPGDSLSKIAKEQYGNAMKYMVIFEANKPMLSDPNKIYPGQVLRIPPLS